MPELARADKAALVSAMRAGLRKLDADVDRMFASLSGPGFTVSKEAFAGLDSAVAHAVELRNKIGGPAYAHPARGSAVAGLDSLVQGLQQLRRRWIGHNNRILIAESEIGSLPAFDREIDRLLTRSRNLLDSADRLLGCAFGCQGPVPAPTAPPFGGTS